MRRDEHTKTLIVQKMDRDLIPCVMIEQTLNDKQYKRGDVIDILPGRYVPPAELIAAQPRWCAVVVPAGLAKSLRLMLLYGRDAGTLRRREFYMDLDALGIATIEGFVSVEKTERDIEGAVRQKPIEAKPWIIGA